VNLTIEQEAICEAARDLGAKSLLKIQAFAGAGKTTTLAAIAQSLPQRKFLYLVFNRAAADEAHLKMPSNVTVRTAHAVAFRSLAHLYKSRLVSSSWAWLPYLRDKMPRARFRDSNRKRWDFRQRHNHPDAGTIPEIDGRRYRGNSCSILV